MKVNLIDYQSKPVYLLEYKFTLEELDSKSYVWKTPNLGIFNKVKASAMNSYVAEIKDKSLWAQTTVLNMFPTEVHRSN